MPEILLDTIERLDPESARPEFDCNDDDLNDFFHIDSIETGKNLLAVTYVGRQKGSDKILSYFSVSNDSLRKEDLSGSRFKILTKLIPWTKRFKTLPAVKIGRLATCKDHQSNGVGRQILDFLKMSFTVKNKTGCRFIVVDAVNGKRTTSFYERNGFEYLLTTDTKDKTRIMFYDLSLFKA